MHTNKKRFSLMALGGTFDHFHAGHEKFLSYAASLSSKLLIGIVSNKALAPKAYSDSIQPYKTRLGSVLRYCRDQHIDCELVELNDPYGPPISHDFPKIDSLCATLETEKGADKINEIRLASAMRPLPIFLAPLHHDQTGTPLHAEKIRAGLINRQGEAFALGFPEGITINQRQHRFFSQPLGPVVTAANHSRQTLVAVVGDYALSQFLLKKWSYNIGVYDHKNERQPFTHHTTTNLKPSMTLINAAGEISADTFRKLKTLDYNHKQHLLVEGEEDLVTAALILTMPLNSLIYYGQPGQGMVKLTVSEELKAHVWKELKK